MAQLNDEQLFYQLTEEDNSIAIIVKHLWGNMLSRWTNFFKEDGEKDWRNRDQEFLLETESREDILAKWEEGWACLFKAVASITKENFEELIYIRNQGHSVVEACNRQLSHYAYHVGQMVFLGKMIKKKEWVSLSIPKGDSKNYNQKKFGQEKRRETTQ